MPCKVALREMEAYKRSKSNERNALSEELQKNKVLPSLPSSVSILLAIAAGTAVVLSLLLDPNYPFP